MAAAGAVVAVGVWVAKLGEVAPSVGERAAALPGDRRDATLVCDRGIDVAAPAAAVWPWLVQMGYRRAGWYSHDRLEAMLGAADYRDGDDRGTRSSTVVVDGLQDLAEGDVVPLGPGADLTAAVVRAPHLTRPGDLVLTGEYGRDAWALGWVWAWRVRPVDAVTSRLHVRTTITAGPLLAPIVATLLRVGHAEMERAQLVNLRRRVERR